MSDEDEAWGRSVCAEDFLGGYCRAGIVRLLVEAEGGTGRVDFIVV